MKMPIREITDENSSDVGAFSTVCADTLGPLTCWGGEGPYPSTNEIKRQVNNPNMRVLLYVDGGGTPKGAAMENDPQATPHFTTSDNVSYAAYSAEVITWIVNALGFAHGILPTKQIHRQFFLDMDLPNITKTIDGESIRYDPVP